MDPGYFRIFIFLFFGFSLVFLMLWGLGGLAAAFVLSLAMTPLIMLITIKIGGVAGKLFTGVNREWDPEELLAIEFNKVRSALGHKRYDEGLRRINQILLANPDHPEALYLKARIVWQGFQNHGSAVSCLNRILTAADRREQYHRWARNFLAELEESRLR